MAWSDTKLVQQVGRWLGLAWVKPVVLLLCGVPLASLLYGVFHDSLGANPAETLIRSLGEWSLRLLCLTLLISPLRQALHWSTLVRWRRGLGLWTFVYTSLHLLAYAGLDMGWDWPTVWQDVLKRPFIWVGLGAWCLLLPLAATSFQRAMRALGPANWQRLHRLVYVAAGLALLHFYWMRSGKRHYGEVYFYAAVVLVLMLWRVWHSWRSKRHHKVNKLSSRS